MAMVKPFSRLNDADEERLVAFFAAVDLLVKGTDKGPWPPFRGGCLDWVLAACAPTVWFLGGQFGFDPPLVRGSALALLTVASLGFLRSFRAVRRYRRLTSGEEGWHGIAWNEREFCLRSLGLCALASWSEVKEIRHFPASDGGSLADTLWIHLDGGERLLMEARDGFFAGRPLSDWNTDLCARWGRIAGSSEEALATEG
ncbi:MAG: hypothetical protein CMP23_03285 [Rickettsiales bacterium]|nr:hypothetical protein [Rickettsiales bacterium]|tara:strand:- start:499 stop:1098 length:600 start_codon:yes stop_codon:yes gene_type:complete